MKQSDDEQYLHLLSIFHYVVAGIAALIACFPIIHVTIGLGVMIAGLTHPQQGDGLTMVFFGLAFVLIGGTIILFGWSFAACMGAAGRFLSGRRRYMFCLVMAGVECIFSPFGTVLGVLTIIVLVRPTVKELFMPHVPETAASQAA